MQSTCSQSEIVKQDNLLYSINKEEKTASIIGHIEEFSGNIIRRSIIYESNEYTITKISCNAFEFAFAESIIFSDDLQLETIEKSAFYLSDITSLTIPKSLINLERGWCRCVSHLTDIKISSENPRYHLYQNKFIFGKSKNEQENYDTLVFCARDVRNIKIPSFIKYIDDYAFEDCNNVREIEIPENSELCSIGYLSFPDYIETVFIPKSVTCLTNGCFQALSRLKNITISPENPKYKTYDKLILSKSSIESDNYDSIFFCYKNIENITIPSFIEIIEKLAFFGCKNLTSVKFPKDSKLRIIDENAFTRVSINSISLPSSVTQICADAFLCCKNLTYISIPKKSQLRTLEKEVFADSSIEQLFIPSKLIELNKNWCSCTDKLNRIDVDQNNPRYKLYANDYLIGKSSLESDVFNVLVFCVRNIKAAEIPCFIEIIDSCAFNQCKKMTKVKFQFNSKLRIISDHAFYNTPIKYIEIPSFVNSINNRSFFDCKELQRVDIRSNSELQKIGENAFSKTILKSFSIPDKVRNIGANAFDKCDKLHIIEFNSQLEYIDQYLFGIKTDTVVMVPVLLSKRLNLSSLKLIK